MLVEDRLELAVESDRLGVGEYVMVVTHMGNEVSRGGHLPCDGGCPDPRDAKERR